MSWYEAEAFCIWDGGRLPTEAEWTYAAAGGDQQRRYPWGSEALGQDASLAVWRGYFRRTESCTTDDLKYIAPVGSVPAGNGRWGHADLAGNMYEFVQDLLAPYGACTNCANLDTGSSRVVRGGAYSTPDATLLVAYYRDKTEEPDALDKRGDVFGFRCARNR